MPKFINNSLFYSAFKQMNSNIHDGRLNISLKSNQLLLKILAFIREEILSKLKKNITCDILDTALKDVLPPLLYVKTVDNSRFIVDSSRSNNDYFKMKYVESSCNKNKDTFKTGIKIHKYKVVTVPHDSKLVQKHGSKNPDFKTDIQRLGKMLDDNQTMSKPATAVINDKLGIFFNCLMGKIQQKCSTNVTLPDVISATNSLLTTEGLRSHAVSEGFKMIQNYEFIPIERKKRKINKNELDAENRLTETSYLEKLKQLDKVPNKEHPIKNNKEVTAQEIHHQAKPGLQEDDKSNSKDSRKEDDKGKVQISYPGICITSSIHIQISVPISVKKDVSSADSEKLNVDTL